MESYFTKENECLTRVTIEQYGTKYTCESVYSDENTVEQLLRLLAGVMVASSWSAEQVAEQMHEFANDLDDKNQWALQEG